MNTKMDFKLTNGTPQSSAANCLIVVAARLGKLVRYTVRLRLSDSFTFGVIRSMAAKVCLTAKDFFVVKLNTRNFEKRRFISGFPAMLSSSGILVRWVNVGRDIVPSHECPATALLQMKRELNSRMQRYNY